MHFLWTRRLPLVDTRKLQFRVFIYIVKDKILETIMFSNKLVQKQKKKKKHFAHRCEPDTEITEFKKQKKNPHTFLFTAIIDH